MRLNQHMSTTSPRLLLISSRESLGYVGEPAPEGAEMGPSQCAVAANLNTARGQIEHPRAEDVGRRRAAVRLSYPAWIHGTPWVTSWNRCPNGNRCLKALKRTPANARWLPWSLAPSMTDLPVPCFTRRLQRKHQPQPLHTTLLGIDWNSTPSSPREAHSVRMALAWHPVKRKGR